MCVSVCNVASRLPWVKGENSEKTFWSAGETCLFCTVERYQGDSEGTEKGNRGGTTEKEGGHTEQQGSVWVFI